MRAFYEQCLWITEIFLAKNPDLHHGLLAQFSNSPGALLVHYNCESVCFSRILAAQVLRNQSRSAIQQLSRQGSNSLSASSVALPPWPRRVAKLLLTSPSHSRPSPSRISASTLTLKLRRW
jgi:hypothetical protein